MAPGIETFLTSTTLELSEPRNNTCSRLLDRILGVLIISALGILYYRICQKIVNDLVSML